VKSVAQPRTPAEIALDLALVAAGLLAAALLISAALRAVVPQWGGFGRESAAGKGAPRLAHGGAVPQHSRHPMEAESGAVGPSGSAADRSRGRGSEGVRGSGDHRGAGGGMAGPGETRAQVLNGCGVAGAGAAMASVLRRAGGIDVVEIGNADDFDFESSVVIDRRGDRAAALRVARALGGAPVVLQRSDGCCEVTVIVGYDRGRWLDPLQGGTPGSGH
jgi:LytR cell envelope-related transcriptional attenuator